MDITKEKERRIWKRNCYITLLQKSISNAKERMGEGKKGDPGIVSEHDPVSETAIPESLSSKNIYCA